MLINTHFSQIRLILFTPLEPGGHARYIRDATLRGNNPHGGKVGIATVLSLTSDHFGSNLSKS